MRGLVEAIARGDKRAFAIIFLLAFAVRSAFLLRANESFLTDPGLELARIARSLADTGRFADAYAIPTGATAHLPPVYAGFVGYLWRFFGASPATGIARCLLNIAAESAMLGLLPWFADRFGVGRPAGVIGGLVGAFTPRSTENLGGSWEEPYAALALGFALVGFLGQWTTGRPGRWRAFAFGIALGAALHLAPSLAPVMLGCAVFGLARRRDPRHRVATVALLAGVMLACVPWGVRNYRELEGLVFVRSNFGLELRVGNHEGADPDLEVTAWREGRDIRHPAVNVAEAMAVRELGELEYMRRAGREATGWIRDNPGGFAHLTAQRFARFWLGPLRGAWWFTALLTGLTLLAATGAAIALPRMNGPQRAATLLPLALFPLVYYVVGYMDRYRNPIHWLVLMFAGAALWRLRTDPGHLRFRRLQHSPHAESTEFR